MLQHPCSLSAAACRPQAVCRQAAPDTPAHQTWQSHAPRCCTASTACSGTSSVASRHQALATQCRTAEQITCRRAKVQVRACTMLLSSQPSACLVPGASQFTRLQTPCRPQAHRAEGAAAQLAQLPVALAGHDQPLWRDLPASMHRCARCICHIVTLHTRQPSQGSAVDASTLCSATSPCLESCTPCQARLKPMLEGARHSLHMQAAPSQLAWRYGQECACSWLECASPVGLEHGTLSALATWHLQAKAHAQPRWQVPQTCKAAVTGYRQHLQQPHDIPSGKQG